MKLRLTFQYEADIAGGKPGQFAGEFNPSLHVFTTHGLGVTDPNGPDDGVVVVSPSLLAKQSDKQAITIDLPFNPAGYQYAKLSAQRLWALPGAHSTKSAVLPDAKYRWSIPADASVSFNSYVQTATQHGQMCRTRAGEAMFLLSELLDKTGAEGWDPSKGNDLRAVWLGYLL